jgi:hypothetical protein
MEILHQYKFTDRGVKSQVAAHDIDTMYQEY